MTRQNASTPALSKAPRRFVDWQHELHPRLTGERPKRRSQKMPVNQLPMTNKLE